MFYSFREKGVEGGREFVPGPLPVSQGDENFYALSYFLRDIILEKFMIDDLPETLHANDASDKRSAIKAS